LQQKQSKNHAMSTRAEQRTVTSSRSTKTDKKSIAKVLQTGWSSHQKHGLVSQPNANMKLSRPLDSLSRKSLRNHHQVINSVGSKIFHNPRIINNNKIHHDPF
jgi:hypothetical protein